MAYLGKVASLIVIVALTVSGLTLLAVPAFAAVPKPSVPEFNVRFVTSSYNVTTTDPYTGLSATQQYSNNSIQVAIKNQPSPDSTYHIYYNIRSRPHFGGNWSELYPIVEMPNGPFNGAWTYSKYLFYPDFPRSLNQTNTDFTVATINSGSDYTFTQIPAGAQIDFQVEAIVGHDSQAWEIQHPLAPTYGGFFEPAVAYDTDSGWSSTQTVTIGENAGAPTPTMSASPPQNPTATPTQPQAGFLFGLDWEKTAIVVLVVVVVCLAVGLIVLWRKVALK